MKSSTSANELDEEKKAEVDLDPINAPDDEQTDVKPEEKLPEGPLTDQERQLIYEKGIKFKKKGNYQHALYCLLACVRGLKEGSDFPQLPECLHNIAEIYSQLEDYENAVSFAQAEKLYYETSLINVSNEAQREQGEPGHLVVYTDCPEKYERKFSSGNTTLPQTVRLKGSTNTSSATGKGTESKVTQPETNDDPQGNSAEARSANEYEKLAHMCLKQKNAQLALEYCGKAVKLRQSIYGEGHPVTKRTLDLFTVIYAEMGKEQYSAAMQKFNETKQSEEADVEKPSKPPKSAEPVSENTDEKEESPVDSRQSPVGESQRDAQNTTTPTATDNNYRIGLTPGQAMLWFFLLTAAVAVGVTILCCRVTGKDPVTTFKYISTRIKYYYYYYMKRAPPGNKYF